VTVAKPTIETTIKFDNVHVIKPGQTLILRYTKMIDSSSADQVKTRLATLLPGVDVVILGGVDQALIYDPQSET
jgi:hypothetical protein